MAAPRRTRGPSSTSAVRRNALRCSVRRAGRRSTCEQWLDASRSRRDRQAPCAAWRSSRPQADVRPRRPRRAAPSSRSKAGGRSGAAGPATSGPRSRKARVKSISQRWKSLGDQLVPEIAIGVLDERGEDARPVELPLPGRQVRRLDACLHPLVLVPLLRHPPGERAALALPARARSTPARGRRGRAAAPAGRRRCCSRRSRGSSARGGRP